MRTSFGKYFDDQRDRIIVAMQNKNTQLWKEWRERYDERERKKKMGVKDNFITAERMKELDATFKKELDECSEKGVEISQECKDYYKKKFASLSIAMSQSEKNDEEKTNTENP